MGRSKHQARLEAAPRRWLGSLLAAAFLLVAVTSAVFPVISRGLATGGDGSADVVQARHAASHARAVGRGARRAAHTGEPASADTLLLMSPAKHSNRGPA